MSVAEMERVNQWMLLFQLDVFQIQIVHQKKLALMIFVEIHALVHRMPYAVSKITNRFAHVNKDIMDNQKSSVFILAVDQMTNVQQRTRASIDNVYQFALVTEAHAVNGLNATESITMLCANANQVMLAIQRLDVKLSVVEVTANVQLTKHVSIRSAKVRVIR